MITWATGSATDIEAHVDADGVRKVVLKLTSGAWPDLESLQDLVAEHYAPDDEDGGEEDAEPFGGEEDGVTTLAQVQGNIAAVEIRPATYSFGAPRKSAGGLRWGR